MIDTNIHAEILELALEARETFDKGDIFFTKKRQDLDLDIALDTENYLEEESRSSCFETLTVYLSQLDLEKEFYEKVSAEFLNRLTSVLSKDLRLVEDYKDKALPKIMEGCYLRININREKNLAISKAIKLIAIFEEIYKKKSTGTNLISSIEILISEIDQHLENQYNLGEKQRQNNIDGRSRLQIILQGLSGA